MKDLSDRPLRPAVALDLQKILEGRLVLQAGRSAYLPGKVPFLAQTATGAAVLSHAAVVGVARGASLVVALATVAVTSVAEVVDSHQSHLTKKGIVRSSFFTLLHVL